MAHIFQAIAKEGRAAGLRPNEAQARDWFRDRALEVRNVNANMLVTENKAWLTTKLTRTDVGRMFMFFYDPKHKDTLPYYDTFPLIFPLHVQADRFTGINMHYLPILYRAKLMDALYTTESNKNLDETTHFRINYQILSSVSKFKYFKPCLKEYLIGHVRSRYVGIPPDSWDTALMLPTARFKKMNQANVWKESKNRII